jgi:hypothetical protein
MAKVAESGHGPLPFVSGEAASSTDRVSRMVLASPSSRWVAVGILWFGFLTLGILSNATLLISPPAFDRVAASLDSTPIGVCSEVLIGFGFIMATGWRASQGVAESLGKGRDLSPRSWDRTLGRTLDVAAFFAWMAYAWLLRGPWLWGTTEPSARLDVWSATLSSVTQGLPLLAFGSTLCLGVLLAHAQSRVLRLLEGHPFVANPRVASTFRITTLLLSILLFAVGATVVVGLATGQL